MIRFLLFISSKRLFILFTAALLAVIALSGNARAGNGTFKNGVYDFCISVRFNATPAQLQRIREVFEEGNKVFADALDGQQRFGTIHIVNNSGASQTAEYWINQGRGRAFATYGKYGVRGEHINLFFASDFQGVKGAGGDAYTIAHEHSHHAFGLGDEYKGPGKPCSMAIPICAYCEDPMNHSPTLNFSLMDNYKTRGGRFNGGMIYTLNEFCVASNHDLNHDTDQDIINHGKSCWQTIADHPKRGATHPMGLPIDAPPVVSAPTFHDEAGDLHVMLLLDRSGSMSSDQRLVFAKLGGNLFADFIRTGDGLGVSSFADSGTVNFPLTTVTDSSVRSAAKAAINSLNASGSTNIGGGLLTAVGQITSQPNRSCNEVIVLLSDGDHNVGTPPSAVIEQLQDAGVTVLTIGVGSGISASGEATLQNIANQTGGKYYRVSGAFSLVGVFLRLVMESIGNGLIAHAPISLNSFQANEIPVTIEPGAANSTFAVTFADSSDNITLSLRTPSGIIITEANAGTNPNIQFISGPNSKAFQINAPEAGNWTMIVTAGTINTGAIEAFAFIDHDGVQLNASVTDDTVVSPNVIEIQASPTFKGQRVMCSTMSKTLFGEDINIPTLKRNSVVCPTITGTVTRPGGIAVAISLFDDGLAIHNDAEADDGIYSTRFNNYQGNGTYTFDLTAVVVNGVTYPGENLFSSEPSNSEAVPPFTRSASTTTVVTGVTTAPHIIGISPAQGNRGQTLNVTITGENTNFVNGTSVANFSGSGIAVNSTTVNSTTSATINITIAPDAALTFRDVIVTTDSEVASNLSSFQILPALNIPPVCSNARPSVAVIKPPNRSFVPVSILGVVDPDNDPVTIGITTIRQDEPVDHIGDGSFVPDSVINGSMAQVRAESILGTVVVGGTTYVGNGRFYHISFTATDTSGNSCAGIVKVAVPHTQTATPIDGGPLFNSVTAQPARFSDFDGDRKTDLSVFRQGDWYINNTFNGQVQFIHFGLPSDKIVPADYDGDGKTDIAVFRDGDWYLLGSTGGITVRHFGLAGDIPVPADYDGDGKDDLAVFRQGVWYLLQSSRGFAVSWFGLSSDKPIPADYDGDGKSDIAVYREGAWYLLRSSQGFSVIQFGLPSDKPVPSDYDGDGKSDVAVFRDGVWYLLRSSQGSSAFQFGLAGDIPAPADYSGDGKAEIGVFRQGDWYTLNISNGQFNITRFGMSDDKPIPSAFVP
ncbi:MAG: VWA domain-containing protein [Pyrinomonadaceae bacterium]